MEVRVLKPTSAKLLLHLLATGGSAENLSALERTLGMDRNTLAAARQQLRTEGCLAENFSITAETFSTLCRNFQQPLPNISALPAENISTPLPIISAPAENLGTAYQSLFGAPLPQATEQEWLALQPLSEILPVMQYARSKGIEKPIPYITKALKNKAAQVKPTSPVQKTDFTGELMEVTPEMRAGWARAEELLRRRGKGYLLDDND